MGFTGAHVLYKFDVFILALYLLSHGCALLKYTCKHLNLYTSRDGDLKTVLAQIPGTPEQMQAEIATLRESVRNIQMGMGGARIHVPECPVRVKIRILVVIHFFPLLPGVF